MSIRILEDRETHNAVFICNTSGWAFGPVFEDADQAELFLEYLRDVVEIRDPRDIPLRVLENHWKEFLLIREKAAAE
jgi:hypothetical protein